MDPMALSPVLKAFRSPRPCTSGVFAGSLLGARPQRPRLILSSSHCSILCIKGSRQVHHWACPVGTSSSSRNTAGEPHSWRGHSWRAQLPAVPFEESVGHLS